jgi:hypothetical protein
LLELVELELDAAFGLVLLLQEVSVVTTTKATTKRI